MNRPVLCGVLLCGGIGFFIASFFVIGKPFRLLGLCLVLTAWVIASRYNRKVYRDMLDYARVMYTVPSESRIPGPEDWQGCDRTFFDDNRRIFEEHGFEWLEDVVDQRIKKVGPEFHLVERQMLSQDRLTGVDIYQFITFFGGRRQNTLLISLNCELDDGTAILLVNDPASGRMLHPEKIHIVGMPGNTGAEELLMRFWEQRDKYLELHPERTLVAAYTREDIYAQRMRYFEMVREFRSRFGLYTIQDLTAAGVSLRKAESILKGLRRIARPGEIIDMNGEVGLQP